MLRMFFSDVGTPDQRIRNLRAMRDSHRRTLTQLESLGANSNGMPTGPRLTLELGIGLHGWIVAWCEAAERRLLEEAEGAGGVD
jgi:hypothetical protein